MNMTIKFRDGTMCLVLQQTDGSYIIIGRCAGTYQVNQVLMNQDVKMIERLRVQSLGMGATIQMEYV